jgi:negative regulator of sigma E activity
MRHVSLILLLGLTGCMDARDRFPSLLPRPAETQAAAEPARPIPVAAPDAALDARVAALAAQSDSAFSAFTQSAQAAAAKIAVARGTAQGSEPWLDAQVALADLGTARAPLLSALAELETLAIDRGAAGEPSYPALDRAAKTAADNADQANDRSAALEAALSGG